MKYLVIPIILITIFSFTQVIERLPVPIKTVEIANIKQNKLENVLRALDAPSKDIPEIANAILSASEKININPLLIVALIQTESNFKIDAISSKNYKGLMQTPTATMEFADVDILHGVRLLEEKLRYANGDIKLALAYYKAGQNAKPAAMKQGKQQAEQVYREFKKLKAVYQKI